MSLSDLLEGLDWKVFLASVFEARDYIRKSEWASGFKADDPDWHLSAEMRHDVWKQTRDAWCRRTQNPFTVCPFHEDFVVRVYITIGNLTAKARKKWKENADYRSTK